MNESREIEVVNDYKPIENPIRGGSLIAAEAMKEAAEVQAAVMMAKMHPRDRFTAVKNILDDCGRRGLAEGAVYAYPRGGSTVSGPSIRLAEAMAREWGNLDCGIKELSRDDDKSLCMAYAWDLEKNTRFTRIFEVPHIRFTQKGSYKLTDPRDIYENVANNGARRLRACILEAIPGDVTEKAVLACKKTLTGSKTDKPITDQIQEIILGLNKYGVSQDHIEKRLKHPATSINQEELFELLTILNSIRDQTAKRSDFFDIVDSEPTIKTTALKEKLQGKKSMTDEEKKLNADLDKQAAAEAGK